MIRAKDLDEFVSFFVNDFSYKYVKVGKNYFLVNSFSDSFSDNNLSSFMIGSLLGKDNKFFEPSLFLLELLSKDSRNKVFINDQAEWLFLCGRDVFLDNVVKNQSSGDVFLVQNSKDENLGLGFKTKINGKVMVKNLFDRGDFLRREN
jgi:ribosome biogenesis protein Nip4